MGKGLISLQPMSSDMFLYSVVGISGMMTVMHACLDISNILAGKYHYMLYFLSLAMYPRLMQTVLVLNYF